MSKLEVTSNSKYAVNLELQEDTQGKKFSDLTSYNLLPLSKSQSPKSSTSSQICPSDNNETLVINVCEVHQDLTDLTSSSLQVNTLPLNRIITKNMKSEEKLQEMLKIDIAASIMKYHRLANKRRSIIELNTKRHTKNSDRKVSNSNSNLNRQRFVSKPRLVSELEPKSELKIDFDLTKNSFETAALPLNTSVPSTHMKNIILHSQI